MSRRLRLRVLDLTFSHFPSHFLLNSYFFPLISLAHVGNGSMLDWGIDRLF
jgi:hypothetical protein